MVVRGGEKVRKREGKVTIVYRKKFCIYVDRLQREKGNGTSVAIPIHPSNVIITKLHLDKDRTEMLERMSKVRAMKGEKISEMEVDETPMADVD
jgi:large subunit ribosomal protein L26e